MWAIVDSGEAELLNIIGFTKNEVSKLLVLKDPGRY